MGNRHLLRYPRFRVKGLCISGAVGAAPEARLWIFAAERPLAAGEAGEVDAFIDQWAAHDVPAANLGSDESQCRLTLISQ